MRTASRIFKFGRNELDLRSYELRRAGQRIPLSRIPMDFLVLLLDNRGRLVTREEIAARLWPDSQSVDIVQGINTVVARVRAVLNDDAAQPRFIETVIGRGYRFIAEVDETEVPLSTRSNSNGIEAAEAVISSPQISIVHSLPEMAVRPDPERPAAPAAEPFVHAPKGGRTKTRLRLIWWTVASAAAFCVIAGALWLIKAMPDKETESVLQAVPFTSFPGSERAPAFSPDGRQIAFVWNGEKGDNDDIYVQTVGSSSPLRITTDPARDSSPAWSPDGHQIAFLRQLDSTHLSIVLIPAQGGPERALTRVSSYIPEQNFLTWVPDGRHVVVTDEGNDLSTGPLVSVSIEDGSKHRLSSPPVGVTDRAPAFSPDGRSLAFIRFDASFVEKLYVKGSEGGSEYAVPTGGTLLNSIAWTPDSRQLIFSLRSPTGCALWRVRLSDGVRKKLILDARDSRDVAVSAGSHQLAYVEHVSDSNIWRLPAQAGGVPATKLIASSRDDEDPQYSPDGGTIVFSSSRSGPSEIWTCSSNGANCRQLTHTGSSLCGSPSWSPDGRQIAFDAYLQGNTDIYIVAKDGGTIRRVTSGKAAHFIPSWSRDGAWIYFTWSRTGVGQIWKVPSGGGEAVQVTTNGGFEAAEAPDGHSLYYTDHSAKPVLWHLPFTGGKAISIPELQTLATVRYWELRGAGIYFVDASAHPSLHLYNLQTKRITHLASVLGRPEPALRGLSVSPDGRSFLFVQNEAAASNIMLVENFFAN